MVLKKLKGLPSSPQRAIQCILGLTKNKLETYCLLHVRNMTVSEVAKLLGKSRPVAQRTLQSLLKDGLVTRRVIPLEKGGYVYVYEAVPVEVVVQRIKLMLRMWHEEISKSIEEYLSCKIKEKEKKYAEFERVYGVQRTSARS